MEALVENAEGVSNPDSSGGYVVDEQANKDVLVDSEVVGTDPKPTIDEEVESCSEPTDVSDEINRINKKLEEIANLSNVENLNKTNEVVNELAGTSESIGTVEEQSEVVTETTVSDSVSELTETVNNVPEEVTCIEPEIETEQNNEKSDEHQPVIEEVDSAQLGIELISEDEKSNMEMVIDDSQEDASISKLEGHEEFTVVDESEDSKMEAAVTETTQDAADLVEDKVKNLVEGASAPVVEHVEDAAVEVSSEDHSKAEHQTLHLDEESGILTEEQIEITEIETAEVVEAEETHVEFQVIEEDSTQDTQTTAETHTTQETITLVTEGDNGIPTEEIVYVEELGTVEDSVNPETTQASTDTELFIVTHEPEIDPLQTPKDEKEEGKKEEEKEKEEKPKPKSRGRKSNNAIPSHVLGVDINHPSADSTINGSGRPVLKPRLGVKVPYRNLSSQIVSKQEIQAELMERFHKTNAKLESQERDKKFARNMTQRLASKLGEPVSKTNINVAHVSKAQKSSNSEHKSWSSAHKSSSSAQKSSSTSVLTLPVSTTRIEKDSDLLAILEGDDDDLYNEETARRERDEAEKKVRAREREIALKQLKNLPNTAPVVIKPGKPRSDTKSYLETKHKSSTSSNLTSTPQKVKPKLESTSSPVKKPAVVEPQPQLKASMVLKTYSRKRKSVDIESILSPKKAATSSDHKSENKSSVEVKTEKTISTNVAPKSEKKSATNEQKVEKKVAGPSEQKPDTPTPEHPYITKSSRIIKKKVIWDPDDEVSPRAIKSPKPGDTPGSSKQATPVTKQPEKKVLSEKVEKKVVADKTSQEKKTPERKFISPEKKMPKKNLTPKKGKRLSEIDRLLMDEGAVNMLYEVKNTEDAQSKLKKKAKSVLNIEKAEKEIRNKASELLKDLKQNTVEDIHKSLRRKESPPLPRREVIPAAAAITRKISKDSTASSRHSPPASPAFPYEASRIIRRHSSSSFSSIDDGTLDKAGEKPSKKRPASGEGPKAKKARKAVEASAALQKGKARNDVFVPPKEIPIVSAKQKQLSPENKPTSVKAENKPTPIKAENKPTSVRMVTIKRNDKVVTVKLHFGESEPYLSAQVLKEVTTSLNKLAKDSDCHGVIISSSSNAYCLGLNYKLLVADTEEARKKKATELATQVRDFLKCLLNFPKVLIAGVQGDCIGLGVTMLSLFDMVIASDKAQFSMPYGTFGCAPEAAFLLTVPHLGSHGLASELFYTSSKLSASEVARHGLVTRLCWPEKYADELKAISTSISLQSLESIESAKEQLRQGIIQSTESAITSQTKTLIEHWISDECQSNFANFKMEIK